MNTVPFGLGEEEDLEEKHNSKDTDIQPEEATPANMLSHGASNNWTNLSRHQY
jgi:hypothetical protein